MISGKTKLVGLIGHPVEHSISPAIHNSAFAAHGLDYAYLPLPVEPANLAAAIAGIKALSFAGANVTIPFKVDVMPYLDEIDSTARFIGAVNTIVIKNGKSIGYNTDAEGFIKSLQQKAIVIKNRNAVLLGAGGAARAVVCGLIGYGVSQITVLARNRDKAEQFAQSFENPTIFGGAWDNDTAKKAMRSCHILINCTPLGMHPMIDNAPPLDWDNVASNAAVCDLIYNPTTTKFLATAAQSGYRTLNGEGMLVEQAALAFKLWTGQEAPRNVMYETFITTFSRTS
ncbi:Shikimate dehydrogenase (NADP(+)) [bioreactor metagenome]|uniref:shikimate dehydrogenase (NADP(+)) n=1 Tax=bioreactor metagenome TaxID=1076179 RepID=A0A644T2H4_9ZZZZ|nr:shikimate dehydrogenase [Negativicutes bacterium]